MAIGVYDKAAFANYTPLSAQEILMPAANMRERHDKVDEEYATLNDELQKVAFIAEHEDDPVIKQQYSNYMNSLSQNRDELMTRGLTSSSRKKMLDLRGRFQSEIQPINSGYQMKVQDVNNFNQMISKDPTYIGNDPSQRRVSDYINNGLQPFSQQGISGALITKMTSEYLSPFSQELSEPELRNLLVTTVGEERIPQYMDYIKKYGYKPGTEGHKKLMEVVKDKVMSSTGVSSWATPEQLSKVNGYIDLASSATIGKDQSQIINNSSYTVALQKQAAKEAAKSTESSSSQGVLWTPNPRSAVSIDVKDQEKQIENLRKSIENKDTDLDEKRKEVKNLFAGHFGDRALSYIDKFESGDMTEEELRKNIKDLSGSLGGKSLIGVAGDLMFGSEIDNYLKEYKKDISKDYKEWVKDNPQGNQEQFLNDYQEDLNFKRTYINDPYLSNNTAVQGFQSNLFGNYLNNVFNSDAIIVDKDGNKKKLKDEKKLNPTIRNSSNTQSSGINLFNPDINSPSIDYITTDKDGNPYNVSIPLTKGSNEYKIIKPYSDILKEINKPYKTNRKINIGNNEYLIKKGRDDSGKLMYYVQDKEGNKVSLEQLQSGIQMQLENLWTASSQPISKY